MPDDRKPVDYNVNVTETVSAPEDSVHMRLRSGKDQKIKTEALSGFGGRNAAVEFNDDGGATLNASGRPRQGAHGEKDAVHRAAVYLRESGALPSDPHRIVDCEDDATISEPIDCLVLAADGTIILRAQVVRAGGDLALPGLGRTGAFKDSMTCDELAHSLMASIAKKAEPAKYGTPATIRGIVLVLDAMDHQLALATEPVVQAFLSKYSAQAAATGFEAVLLVGPGGVVRLDSAG